MHHTVHVKGVAGDADRSHGNICDYYIDPGYKRAVNGRRKDVNVTKFTPICKKFGKKTFTR
jgi:hypothetical protein